MSFFSSWGVLLWFLKSFLSISLSCYLARIGMCTLGSEFSFFFFLSLVYGAHGFLFSSSLHYILSINFILNEFTVSHRYIKLYHQTINVYHDKYVGRTVRDVNHQSPDLIEKLLYVKWIVITN